MKWPFPAFTARGIAGAGVFALTVMVFTLIAFQPALADNDLFKMLAQAVVVQGLVGLAMAHWFTSASKPHSPPQDDEP